MRTCDAVGMACVRCMGVVGFRVLSQQPLTLAAMDKTAVPSIYIACPRPPRLGTTTRAPSLFLAPASQGWLLRHLPPGAVLPGVTSPWLTAGMTFSTCCWHTEDAGLAAAHWLHAPAHRAGSGGGEGGSAGGSGRRWYAVPAAAQHLFERAFRAATRQEVGNKRGRGQVPLRLQVTGGVVAPACPCLWCWSLVRRCLGKNPSTRPPLRLPSAPPAPPHPRPRTSSTRCCSWQ